MNKKKAPPSPRLLRLEADIKAERDPIKAACLKAERAGFLGRQGFFEEARESLDALQKEFAKKPDARVSAWMQIAQGWTAFYEDDIAAASDHLRRAYALSTAMDLTELRALSAAWLAQIAYMQDQFETMANYLKVSRSCVSSDDHLTQARQCLVLAMAYYFSNRLDSAQPWFIRSRRHAMVLNDEAAVGALNYNMTVRRIYYLSVASVDGFELDGSTHLAKMGIESSRALDDILGISIVGKSLQPLLAAFYAATQNYASAVELYEASLEDSLPKMLQHQKAVYFSDLAWCYVNVGNIEKTLQAIAKAEEFIEIDIYIEDRVLIFGRLRQVNAKLCNEKAEEKYKKLENESRISLDVLRKRMLDLLSQF